MQICWDTDDAPIYLDRCAMQSFALGVRKYAISDWRGGTSLEEID
jgi:hypothetical protein